MSTKNPALEFLRELAPAALPDTFLGEVAALYETPPRAYHSIDHIVEMANWFAEVRRANGWQQPLEVWLALLFHDAVYEAGRADNEARSAEAARSAIARHAIAADANRVAQLIELTALHGKIVSVDAEAALFLDCDMAILGSEGDRFAEYEEGIAVEYSALPRDAYLAGRKAFLERLYGSPRIFLSDVFHRVLDWRARANLCRALGRAAIVQAGARVLRARAAEVDPGTIRGDEMQKLVRRMVDAMRAAPGVGLAAPQIGIGLRIFVVEDRAEYVARTSEADRKARGRVAVGPRTFINPTLTPIGDSKVGFYEGCLSVAGWSAYVERFAEVEVSALDEHGEPQTWRTSGWPARILQHEHDHLDGTLYIDRMQTRTFCSADQTPRAPHEDAE